MRLIPNYTHQVASHCESGSVRNVLHNMGLRVSEPMIFGIGSGPLFYYLFFAKAPSGLPLIAIRNSPGSIFKTVSRLLDLPFFQKSFKSTDGAMAKANELLESDIPVIAVVDMFYMKYLPKYLHVHAPFHTIVLIGRDADTYAVSDPYYDQIAYLKTEDLRPAWQTHAPLAKNNFLAYVTQPPKTPDWARAVVAAIQKTCNAMLLPPGINRIFAFVGIEGFKTYAKAIPSWPDKYRGVRLREGILFNAVGFEDQGTGGGAFRLMYGAFLQEAAQILGSNEIDGIASQMIEHGQQWQEISRKIIKVGKTIPQDDDAYASWYSQHREELKAGLRDISRSMSELAAVEEQIFRDLKKAIGQRK